VGVGGGVGVGEGGGGREQLSLVENPSRMELKGPGALSGVGSRIFTLLWAVGTDLMRERYSGAPAGAP
jgi:hypothetical protein